MDWRNKLKNCVVCKFGGSSLSEAEQFRKVKSIILSDNRRKYIIPSAPGKRNTNDYKITDLFYLCHSHVKQNIPFDDVFSIISVRYNEIVNELNISLDINRHLGQIKSNIKNESSIDYVISRGEYLNGLILSCFLGFEFVDAKDIIIFNKFGILDLELSRSLINKRISKLSNAIVPGFYGATLDGEIKTFPRGGSDITGSLISYAVNAGLYENWTDVCGFLMADPRIIKDPQSIKYITYEELRKLSYMGATVLHKDSISYVMEVDIPINIKNTNLPEDIGTIIVRHVDDCVNRNIITGIAGKKNVTLITIKKHLINCELESRIKLLSIITDIGLKFENISSGIDSISIIFDEENIDDLIDSIVDEIEKQCSPDSIKVYSKISLVTIVSQELWTTKNFYSKIFSSLDKKQINVKMINQNFNEIYIILGIENSDFEMAIQSIYETFT
jgi:aspartate kinase